MKLKVEEQYGAVVLGLKGNLMGGAEAIEFGETLRKLLADGKKNLVLDLGEVAFMNSSGLGMMISGLTTVKKGEGSLKLARVTDKIQSLLVITKLITIFEHYETVEDAIKSFSK